MSIDSIAGFFSGKDRSVVKTQTAKYQEPGLQTISLNQPIAENPDQQRVTRNKLAELNLKQKAA